MGTNLPPAGVFTAWQHSEMQPALRPTAVMICGKGERPLLKATESALHQKLLQSTAEPANSLFTDGPGHLSTSGHLCTSKPRGQDVHTFLFIYIGMNILYKTDTDVHLHMYIYAPCVTHHLHTSELGL